MNKYELTILTRREDYERVARILDGLCDRKDIDESRERLAYKIAGQEFAIFYYIDNIEISERELKLLSRYLEDADWCIRYLFSKKRR